MLMVLGEAKLGEGALEAGHTALSAMIQASRAEEGCIDYTYSVDILDPTRLMITEKWVDNDALVYHFGTPHMAAFQKAISELDVTITQVLKYQEDDGAPLM